VARYQFDDVDQQSSWIDNTTQLTQVIVRAVGFILMFVGLWIGLKVINEAWSLYQQPQNIERLARAIEKGSNLDKALSSVDSHAPPDGASTQNASGEQVREINTALGFRLSYFVAWIIAILLLMLVGRLSIAAIKTGGELALYDLQIKHFAKYLIDQAATGSDK
jgi:disulfide bond formation protein DsbB